MENIAGNKCAEWVPLGYIGTMEDEFEIIEVGQGEFHLVAVGRPIGNNGMTVSEPFSDGREVEATFARASQQLAKAKQKALRAVNAPDEAGARSGQRTIAKIPGKVDPR